MTEQEKRRAAEREEIAARVASFKATQEKFERERDEYFTTTLQNARGIKPIPFWSYVPANESPERMAPGFVMSGGRVRYQ
jgi:hypothetical protein